MKTEPVLVNPHTGLPRHPLMVESDPQGLLIVPPGAPLIAAPKGLGTSASPRRDTHT